MAENLEGILTMEMGERVVVVPSVSDVGASIQKFGWEDYLMFSVMLLICILVGVYFGFYRVSKNAQEYLMGGRKMKMFPITMSLIASFISGISILGIPTETYLYGIQYIYIIFGIFISSALMNFFFLPVLYDLQLTSTYEYFEKRFDKKVRLFGAFLFIINMLTWLPIVIYIPALAFNQVIGINVHVITPILCVICIFYTSMGGIKAVVYTDLIQAIIMFGAMVLIIVKGTIDVGGLGVVLERNLRSGRLEAPNLEVNPIARYTLWTLVFGGSINLLQVGAVNQNMVQRYLALPTLKSAKRAVWCFTIGITAITMICSFCGILIYATYHDCDPLSTRLVKEKDQLVPLLVMQVFGDYPGLPGVFVAGLLSASLSSLSTGLNALSAVIYKDFFCLLSSKELTPRQTSILMKLTVVVFGVISVGLVYVIEHLGSVLQVGISIGAVASGPSLGLFTMGMLLPWVKSEGALMGGATSLVFMTWLCSKAQLSIATGSLHYVEKLLTTEGCQYHFVPGAASTRILHFNVTDNVEKTYKEQSFAMHHISYMYYTLLGTTICIVVGVITSFLKKPQSPQDVELSLLSPCIRKFIKPRKYPNDGHDGIIYAFGTTKDGLPTLYKSNEK